MTRLYNRPNYLRLVPLESIHVGTSVGEPMRPSVDATFDTSLYNMPSCSAARMMASCKYHHKSQPGELAR